MEVTAPNPYFDYLDLDVATSSYATPDRETDDGTTIFLNPFTGFGSKQDVCDFQTPSNVKDMFPRPEGFPAGWPGFTEQTEPHATPEQSSYYVDPGLCSAESEDEQVKGQIQVAPLDTEQAGTSRSSIRSPPPLRTFSSASISTNLTPPEQQEPPRKRKARRTKRGSNATEEEIKRNKFLERNRIAASKCREKKKLYVSELEDKKAILERHNVRLHYELNNLLAEVSDLKHQLMAHAKCDDPNIDRWIQKEATRFVQAADEALYAQSSLAFANGIVPELPTPSTDQSRNPSISSTYPSLQTMGFEGLGSGERQGSIAYSHGSGSLYPSPTDATFPDLSPHLKREPDVGFNAATDPMFGGDPSSLNGG